ncbi:MAG: cytochrome c-type biogenesis protein [Candidatus Limnocylindria bacterium]
MSTRLLPVAAGALAALAALAVVAALRPGPAPTRAEQAESIAAELRCPDCQGLSVADSPTDAAAEIRRQIDALLTGGASPDEVRAHFVARYGDWILLAPSLPWAWWLPFVMLAAGAAALIWWLRSGPRADAEPAPPVADGLRARARDEAEALDA